MSNCLHQNDVIDISDNKTPKHLEGICKLYKVLGEKNRLTIVYSLLGEDKCVHELTKILGVSQSLVSHQLQVLREAGIVKTTRRGNEVVYSLSDDHIGQLLTIAKDHANEKRSRV